MKTENEIREDIVEYLNGSLKEIELLNIYEIRKCNNCENYVLEEWMGESELAIEDGICRECMEDGYGN